MKNHFPSPQKGKIRVLAIAILTLLPIILFGLLIWGGILMSIDDGVSVSSEYSFMGMTFFIILVISGWLLYKMFQRKAWARLAWVLMCGLFAVISLLSSLGLSLIWGGEAMMFFFIFTLLYVGLGLYLYRNYHIDAYFRKGEAGLESKIREIGEE